MDIQVVPESQSQPVTWGPFQAVFQPGGEVREWTSWLTPSVTKQVILNPPRELSRAAPRSLLTLQTQSHGPVSPVVLFKHLLKRRLFFFSPFSFAVSTV